MKEVSLQQVQDLRALLKLLSPRQRTHFLKTLTKDEMRVLEVACINLATNNKGITAKQIALLKRFRRQVEIVASRSYKLSDKRRVTQKGGFIPAILPVLGTLVSAFLG